MSYGRHTRSPPYVAYPLPLPAVLYVTTPRPRPLGPGPHTVTRENETTSTRWVAIRNGVNDILAAWLIVKSCTFCSLMPCYKYWTHPFLCFLPYYWYQSTYILMDVILIPVLNHDNDKEHYYVYDTNFKGSCSPVFLFPLFPYLPSHFFLPFPTSSLPIFWNPRFSS